MSKIEEWHKKIINYKQQRQVELDQILKDCNKDALLEWIERGRGKQSELHWD